MIKKIYKKYEIIFNVIFFSIFPIMAFYLMEFYEHNPFEEVRFMAGFFNIILFELIAWILYFVTGRAKWALRAVFIVAMVFGLINHYVMLFRSTPFVPWDIFQLVRRQVLHPIMISHRLRSSCCYSYIYSSYYADAFC